jgi:hypothetical protein
MNFEEELLRVKAEEMARVMDFEILSDIFKSTGYREVVVDPWVHNSHREIQTWVDNNVQGDYFNSGNRWLFKVPKDATMFALKWS